MTEVNKNFVLIINTDTEEHHLKNVDRSIQAMQTRGDSEFAVLSTEKPKVSPPAINFRDADEFESKDTKALDDLIGGLKTSMEKNGTGKNQLVVYVTGHGSTTGKRDDACISSNGTCFSYQQLAKKISKLPFDQLVVVTDGCYSGAVVGIFAGLKSAVRPKSSPVNNLIITAGAKGETVACQTFTPHLFNLKAPDYNNDGTISFGEAYRYALSQKSAPVSAQLVGNGELAFSGQTSLGAFPTTTVEVNSGSDLEKELQQIQPDQRALVVFSADWCGPCKAYEPLFQELAKRYGGQFKMIVAKGIKGSESDWAKYGISGYPTVAFVDRDGNATIVNDKADPIKSIAEASALNQDDLLDIYRSKLSVENSFPSIVSDEEMLKELRAKNPRTTQFLEPLDLDFTLKKMKPELAIQLVPELFELLAKLVYVRESLGTIAQKRGDTKISKVAYLWSNTQAIESVLELLLRTLTHNPQATHEFAKGFFKNITDWTVVSKLLSIDSKVINARFFALENSLSTVIKDNKPTWLKYLKSAYEWTLADGISTGGSQADDAYVALIEFPALALKVLPKIEENLDSAESQSDLTIIIAGIYIGISDYLVGQKRFGEAADLLEVLVESKNLDKFKPNSRALLFNRLTNAWTNKIDALTHGKKLKEAELALREFLDGPYSKLPSSEKTWILNRGDFIAISYYNRRNVKAYKALQSKIGPLWKAVEKEKTNQQK